jgi:hypothetical protein
MCRKFAWWNSRVFGELNTFQNISKQLCEVKYFDSCNDLSRITHQSNEICLTENCKDTYYKEYNLK